MLWWTIRKLNSKDRARRSEAVKELERSRRVEQLAKALSHRHDDVRRQSALALARMGDRRATPCLVRLVASHDDRAVEALCGLGDPVGLGAIVSTFGYWKGSPNAWESVVAFLKRVRTEATPYLEAALLSHEVSTESWQGPHWAARRAAGILESIGWSIPPGSTRILFLILLDKYGKPEPEDVPYLAELSRHSFVQIRVKMAEELGKLRGPASFDVLGQMLHDDNRLVREKAISLLSEVADASSAERLRLMLNDQAAQVRAVASKTLGQLRDAGAVESLILLLKDSEYTVRESSAYTLGQIADSRAADSLLEMLNDKERRVDAAVLAVAHMRLTKAVPVLVQILNEPSLSTVQNAAARAVGQLNDPTAVQPLRRLVHQALGIRLIVGESEGYARRDLAGIAINSLGQIVDAASAEVLG